MSFTTCLLCGIVAFGDSTRALFGEILKSWLSESKRNALIALDTCRGRPSYCQVAKPAAGR